LAGGTVRIQNVALQILDENRVRRIFKQLPKPALAVAQLLLGADALQSAAALVGQRLERLQIGWHVAARRTALDEEHANDMFALADGRNHSGATLAARFLG